MEDSVKAKIQAIKERKNVYTIGRVLVVQDYIIEAIGLENAAFYERVVIGGDKAEGYVTKINKTSVVIALVKQNGQVSVGDEVIATGNLFGAFFSGGYIGHVVDMFGNDRMHDETFAETKLVSIENKNIPIMDRTAVNRPLETGIAGIDLIYPIGKGQRQLIVGDKKTGKTQIGLDTIVNQRGKDVLCIYIAVGKTKKSVKEIFFELLRRGAMDYTIILTAFNEDTPPMLSLTPYAGLAFAEQFLAQKRDVLVVIDDLSRHAAAYREIALKTGKVPGRDAYPPDIFYTHSRLLEKGCQHKNGGSITILPIMETKGGDITDYITTNCISITDGQIVLSKKNFDRGEKPAIQYGLSVSRLGGAVQTKPVKKLGAVVRRELLSYLETREVYELTNMDEMSPEMQEKLRRGATILRSLVQPKFAPLSHDEILERFSTIFGEKA